MKENRLERNKEKNMTTKYWTKKTNQPQGHIAILGWGVSNVPPQCAPKWTHMVAKPP